MRLSHAAIAFIATAVIVGSRSPISAGDAEVAQLDAVATQRLHALAPRLAQLAQSAGGLVALTVGDLRTGRAISINGGLDLPAASTIKVPVMFEVFRQMSLRKFTLNRTVTLLDVDRDCGYGALCDAPTGSRYRVAALLAAMIDVSDNTATNMLIRLVGRQNINQTMAGLGLHQTWLGDSIRSDGDIRVLRTSADDMLQLLSLIAARRAVDERSSDMMLALLAGQRHNTLLPEPLPRSVVVAHKTGTLHDTLNDVGIVELDDAPYVICAFATHLADLDDGEHFIRQASLMTYQSFRTDADERRGANARS